VCGVDPRGGGTDSAVLDTQRVPAGVGPDRRRRIRPCRQALRADRRQSAARGHTVTQRRGRREGVVHGLPERRLIQAIRYPNPLTSKVAAYSLPTESIPAFTAAIELLDDLHRRLHE
jgi:hypothetical protein